MPIGFLRWLLRRNISGCAQGMLARHVAAGAAASEAAPTFFVASGGRRGVGGACARPVSDPHRPHCRPGAEPRAHGDRLRRGPVTVGIDSGDALLLTCRRGKPGRSCAGRTMSTCAGATPLLRTSHRRLPTHGSPDVQAVHQRTGAGLGGRPCRDLFLVVRPALLAELGEERVVRVVRVAPHSEAGHDHQEDGAEREPPRTASGGAAEGNRPVRLALRWGNR